MDISMKNFSQLLEERISESRKTIKNDNYDFRRFGRFRLTSNQGFRRFIYNKLITFGIYSFTPKNFIFDNIDNLSWLHQQLDKESQEILLQVITYRILGEQYVRLPVNTPEYWKKLEQLDKLAGKSEKIKVDFLDWYLHKMNLANEGYPIELFARPSAVYNQMILQQYRCIHNDSTIEVEQGDIVIDAGSCYGDTALNFAFKTGTKGYVYAFEFLPENIKIFKRNMSLNRDYAKQICLIERALWSISEKELYLSGAGPGTSVTQDVPTNFNPTKIVKTYSIDDLQQEKRLNSVDFIKMDIEGAELEALKGASHTIKKYKPKLAISVYHNLQDFWEIPQWIDSLEAGYKFHLRHFTIHADETVLFAEACS